MSDLDDMDLPKSPIKINFESETITIPIQKIIPLKMIAPNIRTRSCGQKISAIS